MLKRSRQSEIRIRLLRNETLGEAHHIRRHITLILVRIDDTPVHIPQSECQNISRNNRLAEIRPMDTGEHLRPNPCLKRIAGHPRKVHVRFQNAIARKTDIKERLGHSIMHFDDDI